jgi:hypothetical protein
MRLADAKDDVGVAGSEVADGEVHSPHHAHLQQRPARWSSGEIIPLFFPTMFSLSRWRSSSSQLFCVTNATGCGTRRDWGEEGGPAGLLE